MASDTDWSKIFNVAKRNKGLSVADIEKIQASLVKPLTKKELAAIRRSQSNPFPRSDPLHKIYTEFDATLWKLPDRPLPPSYVSFLQWSNGGRFASGKRRFEPLFSCQELRDYLIAHHVPEYMSGALPIAFDGGGNFYLIDMRRAPVKGEFPIRFVTGGSLRYAQSVEVGKSFLEACSGVTDPLDELYALLAKKS